MTKQRILIADDDKVMRNLMFAALKTFDYDMEFVTDGDEAIARMEQKTFDLIITDFAMPKMDGLELTRRIRAKFLPVPIVVVTGDGPLQDLLNSGATTCIPKPFNVVELQIVVRKILEKEM